MEIDFSAVKAFTEEVLLKKIKKKNWCIKILLTWKISNT